MCCKEAGGGDGDRQTGEHPSQLAYATQIRQRGHTGLTVRG